MTPERFSFAEAAEKFGDHPALISPDSRIPYHDYFRLIAETAERLREADIAAGERIAILGPTCLEYPILLMALWQVGAIAIPLNPRFPERQIAALLQKTGCPKLLRLPNSILNAGYSILNITSPKICNPIPTKAPTSLLANRCRRFGIPDFKSAIRNPQFAIHNPIISLDQDATAVFTSGSSGESKAALHSFGNHYFSALGSNLNILFQPGDCWLLSLPLYHVGGLAILFRALAGGGAMGIADEKMQIPEAIEKLGVTHLSLVATQVFRLLKDDGGRKSLASLKVILLGGSAIPPVLIQTALERGLPIHTSYGSTEMSSQITTTPPAAPLEKLFTSGKTLQYREVKIAADGEILVRGKTLFRGYWEGDSLKKPFDAQGWFATGDIGKIDKDGYLIVLGRKDNMFISGGENIQPEEIEAALCQMTGIEQAIVVPLEDEEFGMRPAAFIKMQAGKPLKAVDIRHFLEKRIARFKIPDYFFPWPKTALESGIKIDRKHFQTIAREQTSESN